METINAEEYLLNIPVWTKKKNSLFDVRAFLEELGNPDDSMNIIHVAGTNGKGSVCAFLTSMLTKAGYRTGTFVSPHLVELRERFLLDGRMVMKAPFEDSFQKVYRVVERMMEKGYSHPSFFEYLFLMAAELFSGEKVDYLVLETGLGGRLDATNVVRHPKVCVITSISLDHMEYLGGTIREIAAEKAGIIKSGVPVVYDGGQSSVSDVIEKKAGAQSAPTYPVCVTDIMASRGPKSILVNGTDMSGNDIVLDVPFAADYQAMNAMLAFRALEVADPDRMTLEAMKDGIRDTVWAGRMQEALPGVYLDGAHNIGGAQAFVRAARPLIEESKKPAYLLFAAVSDKDYRKMIAHICRNLELKGVTVAHIDSQRGVDEKSLAQVFDEEISCPVVSFPAVEEAVSYTLEEREEGELLFCVGSLYLIGEILKVLRRK